MSQLIFTTTERKILKQILFNRTINNLELYLELSDARIQCHIAVIKAKINCQNLVLWTINHRDDLE